MRKFVLYAATTAIVMSTIAPLSSQAAVKGFVISGNSTGSFSNFGCGNLGNQLQNLLTSNGNWQNGQLSGNSILNGTISDILNSNQDCFGQQKPEISLPGQNSPEQNKPEQNQPEQNQPEQNQPGQTPDQGENSNSSYVQQVIDLVNEERAKAGLSPLTEAQDVAQAAAVRAQEISTSFSHTRPDGSSFSTALQQSGASFRGAGENIAYGQRTPEDVMNSWMNSQGHRANILNEDFTTIGVGYYENANGTGYWTQLFTY